MSICSVRLRDADRLFLIVLVWCPQGRYGLIRVILPLLEPVALLEPGAMTYITIDGRCREFDALLSSLNEKVS
jgi:hypothetical protein